MADAIAELLVRIAADTSDLKKGLLEAKNETDKTKTSFMEMNQALELAKKGFEILKVVIGDSIQEFMSAESAQVKLTSILRATGEAAGRTAEDLNAMANKLAGVTVFDDDAITNAQALLLTFKSIKGEVYDQTLPAVLDLSSAFGMDLSGASVMLGKALEDPTNGLTALRRVGVSFTEAEKAQITAMQEAGETAKAQGIILDVLKGQVGGVAEAMGSSAVGSIARMDNAVKNLQEAFGRLIATNFQPFIDGITAVIDRISGTNQVALNDIEGLRKIYNGALKDFKENWTAAMPGAMEYSQRLEQMRQHIIALEHSTTAWGAGKSIVIEKATTGTETLVKKTQQLATTSADVAAVWTAWAQNTNAQFEPVMRDVAEVTGVTAENMAEFFNTLNRNNNQMFDPDLLAGLKLGKDLMNEVGDSVDDLKHKLDDDVFGTEKVEHFELAIKRIGKYLETQFPNILNSVISGPFSALGEALKNQSDVWDALRKGALHAMGGIVEGIGRELAAMSAADFVEGLAMASNPLTALAAPGYFASSGIEAAGAAAAYTSAGFLNAYASGTDSARSGLALVGEQGPELVNFGGGETIYNNQQTQQVMGGSHFNPVVTIINASQPSPSGQRKQYQRMMREMASQAGFSR